MPVETYSLSVLFVYIDFAGLQFSMAYVTSFLPMPFPRQSLSNAP